MCIICVKKKGLELPDKKTLENMWDNNPHGAGIALAANDTVYIQKGFLDKGIFLGFLEEIREQVKDFSLLLHFRIATHGGINQECTHPFPIAQDENLKKVQLETNLAVAHNGIIKIDTDDGLSDTMTYISKVLYNLQLAYDDFYKHPKVLKAIESSIHGSKMAFLDKSGEIYTVGKWIEKDGILYSNDSYEEITKLYELLDLPDKAFCYTNAYAITEEGIDEEYPLFVDAKGKLYEYDEGCSCMWEYIGEYITEDGGPVEKFNRDYSFVESYVDYDEDAKKAV